MNGFAPKLTAMMVTLCRDCAQFFAPKNSDAPIHCPACRSPRYIRHAELNQLSIAHLDCDAFYAAIEKRDNPRLHDKPVIVGGGQRGVVATCCYIARIRGIHSAMPMYKATKLCPDAVIIHPDMKKYAQVGYEIRAMMRALTPLVEPLSIDEAFMDLRGTEKLHGGTPAQSLVRLAKRIEKQVGISVSIGLSHNKFLAKLASDINKPRGFVVIGAAETMSFLADLPVSKIWGVGRNLQKKLAQDGIHKISQLQNLETAYLVKNYDSMGLRLAQLSKGQDERKVTPQSVRKSISSETTFAKDLRNARQLEKHLWQLCEKVSAQCKAKNLAGKTVILKLKSSNFISLTRNHTLLDPTQLADEIFTIGQQLLHQVQAQKPKTAFRLIGIGVSGLVAADLADPPNLADPNKQRRKSTEQAMDAVRHKFGKDAIKKGRDF